MDMTAKDNFFPDAGMNQILYINQGLQTDLHSECLHWCNWRNLSAQLTLITDLACAAFVYLQTFWWEICWEEVLFAVACFYSALLVSVLLVYRGKLPCNLAWPHFSVFIFQQEFWTQPVHGYSQFFQLTSLLLRAAAWPYTLKETHALKQQCGLGFICLH